MALTVDLVTIDCADPSALANRVHLDLRATDRAAEVERLVGIGATVIDEQVMSGFSWTVLADPVGTVFCVGSGN